MRRNQKPINADNTDLIGQYFRPPSSIVNFVVEDVHPEEEGTVLALNPHSRQLSEVEARLVRIHSIPRKL